MNTTDVIASFALVVSLLSFWLSYRSTRSVGILTAAEKRYEAYDLFFEILLSWQGLYSALLKLQENAKAISAIPARNERIEKLRYETFQRLEENIAAHQYMLQSTERLLDQLKTSKNNDPVIFERTRSFAKEVSLRSKQIASNISNIETQMNELFTITKESTK